MVGCNCISKHGQPRIVLVARLFLLVPLRDCGRAQQILSNQCCGGVLITDLALVLRGRIHDLYLIRSYRASLLTVDRNFLHLGLRRLLASSDARPMLGYVGKDRGRGVGEYSSFLIWTIVFRPPGHVSVVGVDFSRDNYGRLS